MTRTEQIAVTAAPRPRVPPPTDPAGLLNGTRLLTTDELALATGLSRRFWQRDRTERGGCPFLKLGNRVRYEPAKVRAYLASRTFVSTSAVSAAAGKTAPK